MSESVHESVAAYGAALRRLTVREFYRAVEKGIFRDDERLELIRGEVVAMSPQKSRHAAAVDRTEAALQTAFPNAYFRSHSPIALDEVNEPEPDLAIVAGVVSDFDLKHPSPADVLLVVEVADTTLRKDRTLKAELYAEFGVPEYWIVNLVDDRLEIFRNPRQDSKGKWEYAVTEVATIGAKARPERGNGQEVSVGDLIPAR